MMGRILITGATGAMGAAAVEALASRGIPVLMACRNLSKAEAVRSSILSRMPSADIVVRHLDLASMESVREFAASIKGDSADTPACPIDAVFHNAGVISKGYSLTSDGFENTFSVNYFGPWLLTQLLLPVLPPAARIVYMVSLTCRFAGLSVDYLQPAPSDFRQLRTYARAKRALLSSALELKRQHTSLQVHLADPGVVASDMIDMGRWYDPLADALFKPLCKKPSVGVQPALRALLGDAADTDAPDAAATASPGLDSSGAGLAPAGAPRYFVGRSDRPTPRRYLTPSADASLWSATDRLLNL